MIVVQTEEKKKNQEKEPVQEVLVLFSVPDIYFLPYDPEYIYIHSTCYEVYRASHHDFEHCVCARLDIIVN